ncbi:MAG TPA: malectin domain-containing carbohydrate-binding protein, partial [Verrucomicrobiae bacterium]
MNNANRLARKWAGCFAVMLAVALLSGCQSDNGQTSASAVVPTTSAPAPTSAAQPAMPASDATAAAAVPVAVTPPVRIKAGVEDKMTDSEGNVWLADEGYADGETYSADDAEITGTPDPALYRTERYSMTAYNFAVPNGKYTVKLLFAEVYSGITGPGDRVFSFDVQKREFKDFDIWVKAGGFGKAYVQSVDVDV